MGRPLGVTILAAGMILAGVGFGAAGIAFLFMGSTGATASQSGAVAALMAAVGAAAGVIFLFFGVVHVVLAIAVFQLRNVARVLTIILFFVIAAGACLGLLATLLSYSHVALAWHVSILALDALALWYLFRSQTKEAFHA